MAGQGDEGKDNLCRSTKPAPGWSAQLHCSSAPEPTAPLGSRFTQNRGCPSSHLCPACLEEGRHGLSSRACCAPDGAETHRALPLAARPPSSLLQGGAPTCQELHGLVLARRLAQQAAVLWQGWGSCIRAAWGCRRVLRAGLHRPLAPQPGCVHLARPRDPVSHAASVG